jgi:predicted RNA-binding protein YlqC (UPF0109 family)
VTALVSDPGSAPIASAVLGHVVRSLVDDPASVIVEETEGRRGKLLLEVRTGPGDMGRVIGRRGKTAQAIRAVARAAATKDGVDIDVDFVD